MIFMNIHDIQVGTIPRWVRDSVRSEMVEAESERHRQGPEGDHISKEMFLMPQRRFASDCRSQEPLQVRGDESQVQETQVNVIRE